MNNGVPDDPWARINSDKSWDKIDSKMDKIIEEVDNLSASINDLGNDLKFTKQDKKGMRLWSWLNSLSLTAVTIICFTFVALVFIITLVVSVKYSLNIAIHNMVQEELNKN